MLTPYLKSQFVEKILTDRFGRRFRCLFLVALVDGEIKGHLVSAKEIFVAVGLLHTCSSPTATAERMLPIFHTPKKIFTESVWLPIVSPFIPKDFSFVTSQMPRAPSPRL